MMVRLLVLVFLAAASAVAQPESLNGLKPNALTVATLPSAAANTDRIFAISDGNSANDCTVGGGSTHVICRSTGAVWSTMGGSAVVPAQDDYAPNLFNCLTTTRATTVLTVGGNQSATRICNIAVNGTNYPFTTSATVTISSGTPTVRGYITDGSDGGSAGTIQVRNSAASGVACNAGCTVQNSQTSFPTSGGIVPLFQWTATSSTVWDATGSDLRPFLGGGKRTIAGFGTTATESTSGTTVAVDLTQLATAQSNWYPIGHSYDVGNHAKPAVSLELSCIVSAMPLVTASTFTYALFYATTADAGKYGAWNIYDVSADPTRIGPATTAAALLTGTGVKNSTMGPLPLLPGDYSICFTGNSTNTADYVSAFATTSYLQWTTAANFAQFTCSTPATISTSTITWPLNCGSPKVVQAPGFVFPLVRFVNSL